MTATKQIIFWFCIIVGLTGIAISQELPEHPQPQHQPLTCQFPASVANCVYFINNPADSIPAPDQGNGDPFGGRIIPGWLQSNPPYIYPITHAKTHTKRNMIISSALSAATMSAVIILTHHD